MNFLRCENYGSVSFHLRLQKVMDLFILLRFDSQFSLLAALIFSINRQRESVRYYVTKQKKRKKRNRPQINELVYSDLLLYR